MTIEWSEEYATGVEMIDHQHRQLFKLINGLEALVERGAAEGPEIDNLLMFLRSYTRTHFSVEERCMFKHACPVSRENTKAHRDFTDFLEKALAQRQAGKADQAWLAGLHTFLSDWIVNHICQIDTHLRDCVRR